MIDPMDQPEASIEQQVRFMIRCSLAIYSEPSYRQWAINWIRNIDRSKESAWKAFTKIPAIPAEDYEFSTRAVMYVAEYAALAAKHATYGTERAANVKAFVTAATVFTKIALPTINLDAYALWAYSDSLDVDGDV